MNESKSCCDRTKETKWSRFSIAVAGSEKISEVVIVLTMGSIVICSGIAMLFGIFWIIADIFNWTVIGIGLGVLGCLVALFLGWVAGEVKVLGCQGNEEACRERAEKIVDRGRKAAFAGVGADANPFSGSDGQRWLDGWIEARRVEEE